MLRKTSLALTTVALITLVPPSFAHEGAMGVVKERMDGMSAMGKALKSMSEMLKGTVAFDGEVARLNAEVIKSHSGAEMIKLFPKGATQSVSEARPEIWTDWERFSNYAMDLEAAAQILSDRAESEIDEEAFKRATDTCAACHKSFRQKK